MFAPFLIVRLGVLATAATLPSVDLAPQVATRLCWAAVGQMQAKAAFGSDQPTFAQTEQAKSAFGVACPSYGVPCRVGSNLALCNKPGSPNLAGSHFRSANYCFDYPLPEATPLSKKDAFVQLAACKPIGVEWCDACQPTDTNPDGHWALLTHVAIATQTSGQKVFGFGVANPLPCCQGNGRVWIPYATYHDGPPRWPHFRTQRGAELKACYPNQILPSVQANCDTGLYTAAQADDFKDGFPVTDELGRSALAIEAVTAVLDPFKALGTLSVTSTTTRLVVSTGQLLIAGGQGSPQTFGALLALPAFQGLPRKPALTVSSASGQVVGTVIFSPVGDNPNQWTIESIEDSASAIAHPLPPGESAWVELVEAATGTSFSGSSAPIGAYTTQLLLVGQECLLAPAFRVRPIAEVLGKAPFR